MGTGEPRHTCCDRLTSVVLRTSIILTLVLGFLPATAQTQPRLLSADEIFDRLNRPIQIEDTAFEDDVYSPDDIKADWRVRRHLPSVDLNTITFLFGSSEIPYDERPVIRRLARALKRFLDRNPNEVFLIEGHTDAVGDASYNRALSEERAYSVLEVLVRFYDLPAYAFDAIGYGEEFLNVQTHAEDWRNRRVTVRRMTEIVSRPLSRPDRLEERFEDEFDDPRYDPYDNRDTVYDLDDLPRSSVTVD